ncbi:hypothetical protein C8Q74DRAFT_167033 [Fomes fomentarius]|nr:hypothetical protein C8Q74DRAFT_167033 [Fomes fomentarius]
MNTMHLVLLVSGVLTISALTLDHTMLATNCIVLPPWCRRQLVVVRSILYRLEIRVPRLGPRSMSGCTYANSYPHKRLQVKQGFSRRSRDFRAQIHSQFGGGQILAILNEAVPTARWGCSYASAQHLDCGFPTMWPGRG